MEYKYSTINEVNHFEFGEAVVGDIQLTERMFHLVLDNVKICPENSCNRDIRMMRTNELLFKIYLICVILGSLLRNMLGEWEPIYDTYRFVSKGRWGTFFLSFSSIIILVLIFRCFIQYIKKVHVGIRILIISSILYYLIWTVLALDKAPAQSVFFESISTSVILLPVSVLLGFDDNIWNIFFQPSLTCSNSSFCHFFLTRLQCFVFSIGFSFIKKIHLADYP